MLAEGDVSGQVAGDEVGVFVALVQDLLLGGLIAVLFHAQRVDLVGEAPFGARLRVARRLLRAG
jgi:hypothetical protein